MRIAFVPDLHASASASASASTYLRLSNFNVGLGIQSGAYGSDKIFGSLLQRFRTVGISHIVNSQTKPFLRLEKGKKYMLILH